MSPESARLLEQEIVFVRDRECLRVIDEISAILASQKFQLDTIRLMTVPILYSVWERSFSSWTAICLRVIQEHYLKASDCPPMARAFWFRKADFFKSFVDTMRDVLELEREDSIFEQSSGFGKKITKGGFNLSSQLLEKMDHWHNSPLEARSGLSSLVITYSNVNESVVRTNAEAIGLDSLTSFQELDLSMLGKLVGIRNGIGHGAILVPPGVLELEELMGYTKKLIQQYADVTIEWINIHIDSAS